MNQILKYRPDVDGLRAIAVSSVVLYHARTGPFSGGFVGVDIFFVISGFLITSIIIKEIDAGGFSFVDFYERRIRRIFPALFAVIAATLAIGWYVLTPKDYRDLAASAINTAIFLSNFFFNRQAGYFAPAAETQPLLHTWSLAVEEQFYLVAPPALILLYKLRPPARIAAFAIIAVSSLGYAEYGVRREWSEAFYLLPPRAWELMTGMILALGWIPSPERPSTANLLSAAGMALIGVSIFGFSNATPFPGFAALLPCLGSALIIHAGTHQSTVVGRLLSTPPFVGIGKISYSLYLWHWPLLAFAAYEWGEGATLMHRGAIIVIAVILSVATWAFVEQPARKRKPGRSRAAPFASGLAAIVACLVVSQIIKKQDGFITRVPPEGREIARAAAKKLTVGPYCRAETAEQTGEEVHCFLGDHDAEPASFLFWGDSHAVAVAGAISAAAVANRRKGAFLSKGGCPPFLELEKISGRTFSECARSARPVLGYLKDPAITDVVILARWALYAEGTGSSRETSVRIRRFADGGDDTANREIFAKYLKDTVTTIRAAGKRVVLIASIPELPGSLPSAVLKDLMRGKKGDYALPRATFDKRQASAMAALKRFEKSDGVSVLYPHDILCSRLSCRSVMGTTLLYHDDDHLNAAGAALLEPLFDRALAPR